MRTRSSTAVLFLSDIDDDIINMYFKVWVTALLPRIGRAIICNKKSTVWNMGKSNIKGYCD